jgi:hypothetical protein
MARIFLLIFVWILSALSLLKAQTTQNFSLSGKVDSDKVNQMEINLFDSENKLIKTEIADNKGNFVFTDLVSGNYSIKINKNGTEAYKADNISVSGNTTLPSIQLNEKMIESVTITKTKPYIERQNDPQCRKQHCKHRKFSI